MHAELRCAECHTRRVGGNGSAIYRPAGRIQRPAALLSMVELCNTELKLQLFPDDVAALAAALNQDHFRTRPPARCPPDSNIHTSVLANKMRPVVFCEETAP